MQQDDAAYYRRRAEMELERAQRAHDPAAARAHGELASAYLARAGAGMQTRSADASVATAPLNAAA